MSLTKSDALRETEEQKSVLQKTSLESEVSRVNTTLVWCPATDINHKVSSQDGGGWQPALPSNSAVIVPSGPGTGPPAGDGGPRCLPGGPPHLPPGHRQGEAPGDGGEGKGRPRHSQQHREAGGPCCTLQRPRARPPETDGLLCHQDWAVRHCQASLHEGGWCEGHGSAGDARGPGVGGGHHGGDGHPGRPAN